MSYSSYNPDSVKPYYKIRVRRSLQEIQNDFTTGKDTATLENLVTAWAGIQALPSDDPNSFFVLGGFHGEPFRGAGWSKKDYWGGWCNHGNVLFPLWHRIYLFKLEEALRSIPGCENVAQPFWDEASTLGPTTIPTVLTDPTFTYKSTGKTIPNPLASFKFPVSITDFINGDYPNYTKPAGYQTSRYPLSGLVGTSQDLDATQKHNAQFPDPQKNIQILNQNVSNWLDDAIIISGQHIPTGSRVKFQQCLNAPNYTLFSNTSSANYYNSFIVNGDGKVPVVALETPHNDIHLAVGGFEAPGFDMDPIDGANGDMGENDTAGLDPIFHFHHCFVDRTFWQWQNLPDHKVEIISGYPGTNSVDGLGATPGIDPNSWLDLDTPLYPFKKADGTYYTGRDAISAEALGFTYSPGSLQPATTFVTPFETRLAAISSNAVNLPPNQLHTVSVRGINRSNIAGSFVISLFANIEGKNVRIASQGVFSRWSVQGCMNCLNHVEASAYFSVPKVILGAKGEKKGQEPLVNVFLRKTSLQTNTKLTSKSKFPSLGENLKQIEGGPRAFSCRVIDPTPTSVPSSSTPSL